MAVKDDIENEISILSSLLYLRSEVKMAGYERTEAILGFASHAFFEDLEKSTVLKGDLERIKKIMSRIDEMNPGAVKKAVSIIESYEPKNDNNSAVLEK